MTQNNERKAFNSIEFNDIALKQQSEAWQAVCCALDEVKPNWIGSNLPAMECAVNAIKELAQSPISQNEQQEAVEYIDELEKYLKRLITNVTFIINNHSHGESILYDTERKLLMSATTAHPFENKPKSTSPPKQAISDGWKPIETAPKGESVLVAGGDCNYPCVANWSGHHEDVWCVDGQMDAYAEIGWPAYWMALDSLPALPTALTNTEVGK